MLNVRGLNQFYGGSHILRDVSFEVAPGTCTAILGRNGVGKSTLLKCLMGLLPAASGSIGWDGMDLGKLRPHERVRRGLGYVPQGREIFPRLTVEENLRMGMAAAGMGAHARLPEDTFALFPGLQRMLHRRGGDLSGGQQQQLAIARALMGKPKLLILDEPTEGIQPSIIKEIERVIRQLARTAELTILLVEQYYDFACGLADQFVVMSRGEVVLRGSRDGMEAAEVKRYLAV